MLWRGRKSYVNQGRGTTGKGTYKTLSEKTQIVSSAGAGSTCCNASCSQYKPMQTNCSIIIIIIITLSEKGVQQLWWGRTESRITRAAAAATLHYCVLRECKVQQQLLHSWSLVAKAVVVEHSRVTSVSLEKAILKLCSIVWERESLCVCVFFSVCRGSKVSGVPG